MLFSCMSVCLSVCQAIERHRIRTNFADANAKAEEDISLSGSLLVLFWFSLVLARNSQGIEAGPDTNWTGLIFFVVGLSILACTQRLATNVGLDDEREWGLQARWCSSHSLSFNCCVDACLDSAGRRLSPTDRTQGTGTSYVLNHDGIMGHGVMVNVVKQCTAI